MWLCSYELYGQRAKGLYVQYPKDWLLFFWLVFMVVQGIFTSLNFLFIHLDPIVTPRQLPLLEAYHLEYQIAGQDSDKGSHREGKVKFFLTLFKRPLTPPPFYLNICPILQGVFFKRVFEH